jgi:hypothetical protein
MQIALKHLQGRADVLEASVLALSVAKVIGVAKLATDLDG